MGCWCQGEDYQGLAAGQILTPLFAVRVQHTYYIHHIDNKQDLNRYYGRMAAPNRIFQTAFDPPPSFSENYVPIFFIMDMVKNMQDGMRAS